jgi:hypothetical protein
MLKNISVPSIRAENALVLHGEKSSSRFLLPRVSDREVLRGSYFSLNMKSRYSCMSFIVNVRLISVHRGQREHVQAGSLLIEYQEVPATRSHSRESATRRTRPGSTSGSATVLPSNNVNKHR